MKPRLVRIKTMTINRYVYHTVMTLWFVAIILIMVGNWKGRIRFGLGLGDFLYLGIMAAAICVGAIIYIRSISSFKFYHSKWNIFFFLSCIFFLTFILLKITIFRGGESTWDGRILF